MGITTYISPVTEVLDLVAKLLNQEFGVELEIAIALANSDKITAHFDQLKENCYVIAETLYVDKVYRNSYYSYYSSKLKEHYRTCIKLSFFDGEILESDFLDSSKIKHLQKKFWGFTILRPLIPFIIGRSVISPKALKEDGFDCCYSTFDTTVQGIKFFAKGFPHSSQDTETMSCAETTLWSTMEYFSNHYQEYKSILPSKLLETLRNVTSERQLPSGGLYIQQMSFALREYGFGTQVYSRDIFKDDIFEKLISTYVESKIPLIFDLDDGPKGKIGHALLCVGHDWVTDEEIDNLKPSTLFVEKYKNIAHNKNVKIYDWHSANKNFAFVDDNKPPYIKAPLSDPTKHYSEAWKDCKIKHFIAPLYPKIYLEAYKATTFLYSLLLEGRSQLNDNSNVLIKMFLSSSRTFKDNLILHQNMQSDLKDMLKEMQMPKFIWIAEISDKSLIKNKLANGIIVLDATEANTNNFRPLILANYQNHWLRVTEGGILLKTPFPLSPFEIYNHNISES